MLRIALAASLLCVGLAGTALAAPDLVVSQLTVTPAVSDVGAEIEVSTAIQNLGDVPVASPGPGVVSTSADLAVVRTQVAPLYEGTYLLGWGHTDTIPPGGSITYTRRLPVPAGADASAGYICADVDLANRVAESNEGNNRRCVNFHARAAKPNLVIRGVVVGAVSGLSRRVRITVQNTGAAASGDFRVDAYQLAPERWQLSLTECALSVRGGSAPCGSLWGSLAPGASRTFTGYVTFPAGRAPGRREIVEFMADGCFARLEPGLPAYCRVDETSEADNTRRAAIAAP